MGSGNSYFSGLRIPAWAPWLVKKRDSLAWRDVAVIARDTPPLDDGHQLEGADQ